MLNYISAESAQELKKISKLLNKITKTNHFRDEFANISGYPSYFLGLYSRVTMGERFDGRGDRYHPADHHYFLITPETFNFGLRYDDEVEYTKYCAHIRFDSIMPYVYIYNSAVPVDRDIYEELVACIKRILKYQQVDPNNFSALFTQSFFGTVHRALFYDKNRVCYSLGR